MTYYSIPLTFALITFTLIHFNAIRCKKWKYFKRYVDPFPKFPVFLPVNILSTFAPIISLSFRMFGNALSGTIILELVYYVTNSLSSKLIDFNFIGPLITPLLHVYFDLFSGIIQTMVFIYLTTFFIKGEEADEDDQMLAEIH
jgi:F-type H+-transporting ATPase subunit a